MIHIIFEWVRPKDPREKAVVEGYPSARETGSGEDEVLTVDAGIKINDLQVETIECYVLPLANNLSARRNCPAARLKKDVIPSLGSIFARWNEHTRAKLLEKHSGSGGNS